MVRGTIVLKAHGDYHDEATLAALPSQLLSAPYVLLRAVAVECKPDGRHNLRVELKQIGPPIMAPVMLTLYALRHVATSKIMPQMKHGRGYTHWNPGKPDADPVYAATDVPRLMTSKKQALKCQQLWAQQPNAEMRKYAESPYSDEGGGEDLKFKADGRKLDDLEIVCVHVVINDVKE